MIDIFYKEKLYQELIQCTQVLRK